MEYQEIIDDLVDGRRSTGLSPIQRRVWPRFAYHFTDIENAVNILKRGMLYSRERAIQAGVMRNDNASGLVIEGTNRKVENYVRLYFRPRTPTQYHSEGFRPKSKQTELLANCPVPVFFLFDLASVLSNPLTRFTDKTLAMHAQPEFMSGVEAFRSLPFQEIFHNRAIYPNEDKQNIIRHRQAEIVVPNELELSYLRKIVTRSSAEKETLLNLLHDQNINQYDEMIVDKDVSFFNRDRSYIERVILNSEGISLFSHSNEAFPESWGIPTSNIALFAQNPSATDDYLNLTVSIKSADGIEYRWPNSKQGKALLVEQLPLEFQDHSIPAYNISVKLDDHIAYYGQYNGFQDDDLPF